jgi:tRNA pseudouridine38-40 synthase
MELEKLRNSINSLTSDDIRVLSLQYVPLEFHARFSALSRTYHYLIGTDERSNSPFCRKYIWHISQNLDADLMKSQLGCVTGEYDFSNLSKNDPSRDNFMSVVRDVSLKKWELGLIFKIRANRFLPQMVRRIVGTLAAIGREEAPKDSIERLTRYPDKPPERVHMAPPTGLFLTEIEYEDNCHGKCSEKESVKWDWRYLHEILH